MNDDLMLIDNLENTLPVDELFESQEENQEENLEESSEFFEGDSIVTYESSTGYDDSLVLEQLHLMNENILVLNGLMAALLFFTVAEWVLKKIHRGVKEVMYVDRDN